MADIVAQASDCQGVLEIGPGPGVLTLALTQAVSRVIAIEVDEGVRPMLSERAPNAQVIFEDALQADWGEVLAQLPEPKAIVSNMPYNITGPLLAKVGEQKNRIKRAVLMMQKEVGDRILAPAGDSNRGSLSVFLEARFEIRRLRKVPPGAFLPPPKVDSIVLVFEPKAEPVHPRLEEVCRAGFSQPRKTLANNLAELAGSRAKVMDALTHIGLPETVRPHQLTLNQWVEVANQV